MHPVLLVLGLSLLVFTVLDALWTTLWVDGHAGPFSRRYSSVVRRLFWYATPRANHRMMSLTGPIILVLSVTTWAFMLWTGWVLLFSGDTTSLVRVTTGAPATWIDRIYFTGYTIATLGNGDIAPNHGIWELATSVASLSGLFVLTLSVTYLLAVLEAVVAKRSFSSHVLCVGRTAEEFVVNSWTGKGFDGLNHSLISIVEQLNTVAEQHQAYPMLHYYHEEKLLQSVSVALTVFDDALMLLAEAIPREVRPGPSILHAGRESVGAFLETLKAAYIDPSHLVPPPPDLERLRKADIPIFADEKLRPVLERNEERRRLLSGFLQSEHRNWPMSRW